MKSREPTHNQQTRSGLQRSCLRAGLYGFFAESASAAGRGLGSSFLPCRTLAPGGGATSSGFSTPFDKLRDHRLRDHRGLLLHNE